MVQIVGKKRAAGPKKGKKVLSFTIDCAKPVEDKIMDIASFEKFLLDKIKVDGKTGGCPLHSLPRARCVHGGATGCGAYGAQEMAPFQA